MDTVTPELEAPEGQRAGMSLPVWLWTGVALAASVLVAALFATQPFTIDRMVAVGPPPIPERDGTFPPSASQARRIRCDRPVDHVETAGVAATGFNGASPSPVDPASHFCDTARADRAQLALVLPAVAALATAILVLARTRQRQGRRPRRPWKLAAGAAGAGCLMVVAIPVTGVPYLRPPLRNAQAVVDKINRCSPNAATIDWVTGMVITIGEPASPTDALTEDERGLIKANGKVGLCLATLK
jgi:hypothetical protein